MTMTISERLRLWFRPVYVPVVFGHIGSDLFVLQYGDTRFYELDVSNWMHENNVKHQYIKQNRFGRGVIAFARPEDAVAFRLRFG